MWKRLRMTVLTIMVILGLGLKLFLLYTYTSSNIWAMLACWLLAFSSRAESCSWSCRLSRPHHSCGPVQSWTGSFCVFIWGCLNAGSSHPLDQQNSQHSTTVFHQRHAWQSPRGPLRGRQLSNQLCLPHVACRTLLSDWMGQGGGALCDSRLGDRERQREMGKGGKDEVIPRW